MKIVSSVSKVLIASALVLGVGATYSNLDNGAEQSVSAKTLSKHFSTTKSAKSKKSLPAKVKYTKRVKQGVGHVTYSGYLKKKSVKKSGGKYVATYSGTLKGHWS
ncbi:TPA: hypothetical protein ACONF0_002665 [Staphylococcus aureus]|jgi:hypothetical protein|uniref:hypothetical protein n=1 Tax=Staphylococcus xylosus TaxID=1288 RepID=UPI0020CF26BE|nr:hypothetical protein [Staphylococcus xylosus]